MPGEGTEVGVGVAGFAADPDSGVDGDVSTPPQPMTSRVIRETAAIARGAPVETSRLALPATSSSAPESRPGLNSAPPEPQEWLQHLKLGLGGGAGECVDGNDVLRQLNISERIPRSAPNAAGEV